MVVTEFMTQIKPESPVRGTFVLWGDDEATEELFRSDSLASCSHIAKILNTVKHSLSMFNGVQLDRACKVVMNQVMLLAQPVNVSQLQASDPDPTGDSDADPTSDETVDS